MNIYIIIPAHNEADFIGKTLQSIVEQTLLPKQLVIVNDNSTDQTQSFVESYSSKHPWISIVNSKSSDTHLPGSKIINAFYKGLETLDSNYDIICKFDDTLIFVEVKTRSTDFFGQPEEFVTSHKEDLMSDAAAVYCESVEHEWAIRFDIISIVLKKTAPVIQHFEDAFFPSI